MLKVLTQLILSVKPRYLLCLYLVCSALVAFSEVIILYIIAAIVNNNFGDKSDIAELFLQYGVTNENQSVAAFTIFFVLVVSKVLSLWLVQKIGYLTELNVFMKSFRPYMLSTQFEKLRKEGQKEFLAKTLTLPEDLTNSLLNSTLQLVPIVFTFFLVFIGLIFAFGTKILLYLILLVAFAILTYFVTKKIIKKTTEDYLNKRVAFVDIISQLWSSLPSITVMKNSEAIMDFLTEVVSSKSYTLSTLRIIKTVPKLLYDNLILLGIVSFCLIAPKLGWNLVYFAYGVLIIQRLTPQISGVVNIFSQYQSGLVTIRRFASEGEIKSWKLPHSYSVSFSKVPYSKVNNEIKELEKLIFLDSVSIKYEDTVIFEHLSEYFYSSEMVAVVGPSGSGKSTLLEAICGIRTPNEGKVSYLIKDCKVSYVPQFPQLFHFKIKTLAKIWLNKDLSTPLSKCEKNRLDNLLEQFGLASEGIYSETIYGDTDHKLSGGQLMRLTICLALLREPKILVLDEPTASLDEKSAKKMLECLRCECAQSGLCVIISSHDQLIIQESQRVLDLAKFS